MDRLILQIRRAAFLFLIIAVLPAVLLRFMQCIGGLGTIKFPFILHTHSHVAMLGWVFTAIFALFITAWLKEHPATVRKLKLLLFLLIVSVIGMLVTFPVYGYAFWSIFFSTLHIFTQLGFTWIFYRETEAQTDIAVKTARTALLLQLVSAAGALSVGPVAAAGYAGQPLYFLCIYFYLHFQYNGWMMFAVLALLLKYIGIPETEKLNMRLRTSFRLLLAGVILTYAGMAIWCTDSALIVGIAACGAIAQLVGIAVFIKQIFPSLRKWLQKQFLASRIFIGASLVSLVIKSVLQLAAVHPRLNIWIAEQRGVVIAYLHLVLIGFVTSFLLGALLVDSGRYRKRIMTGLLFLIFTFTATELILILSAPFPQFISELNKALVLFILALGQLCGLLIITLSASDLHHPVK